jgi:hypothetical protein
VHSSVRNQLLTVEIAGDRSRRNEEPTAGHLRWSFLISDAGPPVPVFGVFDEWVWHAVVLSNRTRKAMNLRAIRLLNKA